MKREHTAADAVSCLKHGDLPTFLTEFIGGAKARKSSPDHHTTFRNSLFVILSFGGHMHLTAYIFPAPQLFGLHHFLFRVVRPIVKEEFFVVGSGRGVIGDDPGVALAEYALAGPI